MSDTLTLNPNKTKLLKQAAKIHRHFLRDVEELREETRRLAEGGWARPNYCKHGTFIGDPYGGDYLCWACESGVTDLEFALGEAYSQFRRDLRGYETAISTLSLLGMNLNDLRGNGGLALNSIRIHYVLGEMGEYLEIAQSFEKAWL